MAERAVAALGGFGEVGGGALAAAPGRCTVAGEHVDYADGLVCCFAVDLEIVAAVRSSPDMRSRVRSGDRHAEREPGGYRRRGDVADRPLAVVEALRREGVATPPVEIALAADLPEAAGLSSSAALSCAVLAALLRLTGRRLPRARFAAVALAAERDVLGVDVGPLDPRAIAFAPGDGAVLLDCRDGTATTVPWGIGGSCLVACHTGEAHDVAGAGYRTRRQEAGAALRLLGAGSWRDLDATAVAEAGLRPPLDARARHIVTETRRAPAAAAALAAGDVGALGRLMTASHRSLRDDYRVSTVGLDAAVAAALGVPGCHGARMVGGGFGGIVTALVDENAAERCLEAMRVAAGPGGSGAWRLRPGPGVLERCPDVVS